jgi:hypothetical protein
MEDGVKNIASFLATDEVLAAHNLTGQGSLKKPAFTKYPAIITAIAGMFFMNIMNICI